MVQLACFTKLLKLQKYSGEYIGTIWIDEKVPRVSHLLKLETHSYRNGDDNNN